MDRDEHWVTVQEAARRLGVKDDAIRKRIQRGTLRSEKDSEDGRVYVYLDTAQGTVQDTTYDAAEDASQAALVLVEEMRDRIAYLQKMLDEEREARTEEARRKDHIIMSLTQRVPELEAPGEERHAPETASEDDGGTEPPAGDTGAPRRSWWRRFFGFE